jgi:CRP-like cAMP-binding protein
MLAFAPTPGYHRKLMAFFAPKVPEFLRNVSLFQDLDDAVLLTLLPLLSVRKIKSGELVFRELEPSDALYLVEHGQVVVSKHVSGQTDIVLTRFVPGDFFGEMGLFDDAPRSASAYAEIDTTLRKLDRAVFHDILTNRPEMAARICYRLVTVFIQRLRVTNEQAREAIRWGLEATGYAPGQEADPFGRKST